MATAVFLNSKLASSTSNPPSHQGKEKGQLIANPKTQGEEPACCLWLIHTHIHAHAHAYARTHTGTLFFDICSLKTQVSNHFRSLQKWVSFYDFGLHTLVVLPFSSALTMVTQTLIYFESVQEGVVAIFRVCLSTSQLEGSGGLDPDQSRSNSRPHKIHSIRVLSRVKFTPHEMRSCCPGPVDGSLHI